MTGIISYCHIRASGVYRNGKLIFEPPQDSDMALSEAIYLWLGIAYPKFYKMDRLSKYGLLATEVLLQDQEKGTASSSTAVVLSNASSSLDSDLRFYETMKDHASPSLFVYTLPNIVGGEICIRNGFKGESIFFLSPAFDQSLLASYSEMLLADGSTEKLIAGWVEVLNDHVDVFLYLVGRSVSKPFAPHTASTLLDLYMHGKANA